MKAIFIHIGGDAVVNSKEIVAILNIDIKKTSVTARMFQRTDERDSIYVAEPQTSKSIVVTKDGVYYSPVSVQTLRKRLYSERTIVNK